MKVIFFFYWKQNYDFYLYSRAPVTRTVIRETKNSSSKQGFELKGRLQNSICHIKNW